MNQGDSNRKEKRGYTNYYYHDRPRWSGFKVRNVGKFKNLKDRIVALEGKFRQLVLLRENFEDLALHPDVALESSILIGKGWDILDPSGRDASVKARFTTFDSEPENRSLGWTKDRTQFSS